MQNGLAYFRVNKHSWQFTMQECQQSLSFFMRTLKSFFMRTFFDAKTKAKERNAIESIFLGLNEHLF